MTGKTAVVTGGTGGLGRALCLALARVGYVPVALYNKDEDAAARLLAALAQEDLPGRALRLPLGAAGDAAQLAALGSLLEIASAEDLLLVHNACAPFEPRPLHLIEPAEQAALLDTLVVGSLRCTQALLRPLLRCCGLVAYVLSAAVSDHPPRGMAAYVAAKYGLWGQGRALLSEYGARGLRVTFLSPGFMETGLTAGWPAPLRAALSAAQGGAQDPALVAGRFAALLCDGQIRGAGEVHPLLGGV